MSKEYKTAFQVIMDLHKACGGFHSVERAQAAPDLHRHAVAVPGGLLRAGEHHRGQRQQRRDGVAQPAARALSALAR